ncbi:hypothetical protein PSAL_002210 [Pseudooceanicola algae]|uniref:Glycosyltransferase 2-like domain-containing protein n=1 Tax=Pseudooceanicola algae TaxID=1537215 RepID=A0A7T1FN36_9RHOB|nr:hypothetical protein PSAL_002210 [Pseudooceanicola algae]
MAAALSVVIATMNDEAGLARSAAALFEGVQAGILRELIVSDGGSGDGTVTLADEIGARLITGQGDRAALLAQGAAAAQGEWLLLLGAGASPARGWSDAVLAQMQAGRAGVFRQAPGAGLGGRVASCARTCGCVSAGGSRPAGASGPGAGFRRGDPPRPDVGQRPNIAQIIRRAIVASTGGGGRSLPSARRRAASRCCATASAVGPSVLN